MVSFGSWSEGFRVVDEFLWIFIMFSTVLRLIYPSVESLKYDVVDVADGESGTSE